MISFWAAFAWAAPCDLSGEPGAPFDVAAPPDAKGVRVLVLLRVDDDNLPWLDAMLTMLEARGARAGLSVRAGTPSDAVRQALRSALERGHELVVRLAADEIPNDALRGPGTLRETLRPLRRAVGRPRAAEVPLGRAGEEAVLHRVGLRALLETNGPASATPRAQLHLEAQPDTGVVLPGGPYAGPCGDSPIAAHFTPPAADRVTQALYGARGPNGGLVRVTFIGKDPAEAALVARWLDEVALPSGVVVQTPGEARQWALQVLRAPVRPADGPQPLGGGRLVRVDEVDRAAVALVDVAELPRSLPGDLALTEAFQALLLRVAGRAEGTVVRLASLDGPAVLASSVLTGPTELDVDRVREVAEALLDDFPARVPASVPVDGHLLTAAELLLALASVARGDDPAVTRPVGVPEPNATGLGWGAATTP